MAAEKQAAMDGRKDGVAREVIRMEREAVIPILKPKLVMRLAYLIGKPPRRRFSRFLYLLYAAAAAAARGAPRSWSMTDRKSGGPARGVGRISSTQLYLYVVLCSTHSARSISVQRSIWSVLGPEVEIPLSDHRHDCQSCLIVCWNPTGAYAASQKGLVQTVVFVSRIPR